MVDVHVTVRLMDTGTLTVILLLLVVYFVDLTDPQRERPKKREREREKEKEREKQGHQLIEDDDCIVAGHCLIAICDERVRDKFKFLIVHCRASIKVIKRHQGKNV